MWQQLGRYLIKQLQPWMAALATRLAISSKSGCDFFVSLSTRAFPSYSLNFSPTLPLRLQPCPLDPTPRPSIKNRELPI